MSIDRKKQESQVINGHFPEPKLQILRNYPREYYRPTVFEDNHSLAFLDHRPLFSGHCLLIPNPA